MNNRIKTALTVWLAILLMATYLQFRTGRVANADGGRAERQIVETQMEPIAVPGRLLLKYRPGVSSSRRNSLMKAAGVREDREVGRLGVHVLELADGADADVFARVLKLQPEVEVVERDYLCYPVSIMEPNDPLYSSQWHLPAVSCPTAWGMTLGSDQVIIAVCDTGMDGAHPDLAPKVVPGWNVVDNNSDTSPVYPHGTWTAGTAAAAGNNSIGVASPALNCRLMPIRVTSRNDGAAMMSDLAAGVVWAADHGAQVASVSYMGAASAIMMDAGRYIESKGGVLVMSAGNTGTYNAILDTPDIIVVSATDQTDGLAGFTTTGSNIDLAAPGAGIWTTAVNNNYQSVNGTSFSAPLVAGAIGLMLSVNPNLTPVQIDTILKVTADDLGPSGWDSGYGWGRLNVGRAVSVIEAMIEGAPDSTPPAAGFFQPQIGGDANGLIGISEGELVQVNALDETGLLDVTLFADGALLGTSASAPYTFYCDTSLYADGSQHTLTAVAKDEAGNTTSVSTTVTARVGFDATPPTVGFIQPQDGGQIAISSAETVQLSASDNQGVAAVSLIADGALVATVTALPYTFTWDTSSFAGGSVHELSAVAGDQANNWVSTTITVTAAALHDTSAPSVSFQQPVNGGTVNKSQATPIAVNASDNAAVALVSLYADGVLIGGDTTAPYNFIWNTSSMANGSRHTLRAVAADAAGNSSAVSISVTVVNPPPDRTGPSVSFQQPQDDGTVGKSQAEQVVVSASDNVAVAYVNLYADGDLVGSDTSAPYNFVWDTSSLREGSRHTLRAVAFDTAGNSSRESIRVTVRSVDTTAPVVSFLDPQNGDVLHGNETISIGATDNIEVTQVDLLIDNQMFKTWTGNSYTVKWNTNRATAGAHTLTAIAYDFAGNSATVSIVVNVR